MKFAIYSRKSKFTGKGESIENQIELCKQYIKSRYTDTKEEDIFVFEDEGFSGGNTNRPQFKKMMEAAKRHEFDYVVCYKLDRITRNVSDFANLNEQFQELNISFISIKEEFDMSTSMGRAMMIIVSVFSQLERETIAERIRDNMHELAKTGRWLGGNTPTGYRSEQIEKITIDGKVRKACKLKMIKAEADLIKLIYNKFLETDSLTAVETFLLQNHIKTKNKNNFSRFAIKSILQNPVYMIADRDAWQYFVNNDIEIFADESDFNGKHGVTAYNKTIQKQGKANEMRDIKEWIIAVGKHKGVVSGSDWVKVQIHLLQNRSKRYRKARSNTALLSGVLHCGNCGDYMRPKLNGRVNEEGEKGFYYLCETKEKSHMHNCTIKNPDGVMLDEAVCLKIKKLYEDKGTLIEMLKGFDTDVKNSDAFGSETEMLQKKLIKNEKEIEVLVDTLAKAAGTPACDYITKRINELHNMNIEIRNNIKKVFEYTVNYDLITKTLISWEKAFDIMDIKQKRNAVRKLIKKVIWDGENAHICFNGSNFSENSNIFKL